MGRRLTLQKIKSEQQPLPRQLKLPRVNVAQFQSRGGKKEGSGYRGRGAESDKQGRDISRGPAKRGHS